MPFDADTYRANRYSRQAWEELATAREIKSRVARGEAYSWEAPRIETFVKLARSSTRLSLNARRLA
jgi:hypothetical protein